MSTYNQLRLRIHEILTYAVQQWGFDSSFDKKYQVDETFGVNAFTKYGSIDLTFYFGGIDLHISTDKSPSFYVRGKNFGTYPIERVRPWPTPEDPDCLITDDGLMVYMTLTEYEQYLERLLDELSSDRCFEWIDRVEEAEEI
jgi:hypothetical protein